MTIEVRVPQLPESVADATLVAWRKQPGDAVTRDENLVDLETDKVVLEVPAPATGVIKELKVQNGTVVTSGQVLAVIEEGAAARPSPAVRRPHPASADLSRQGERGEDLIRRAADLARQGGRDGEAGAVGASPGRGAQAGRGKHCGLRPRRAHHQG